MKKSTLSLLFVFAVFYATFAQTPGAFNYQAVVRNTSGEIVPNQNVSFKISILQNSESGTVVYTETHSAVTSAFGLANLKIGEGTVVSGTFSPAGWGSALHFIKIEIDPEGGTAFTHIGTSQLLSVPYAFHAQTVTEDNVEDADADPANELQTISLSGTQLSLSDGGGSVTLPTSGGGDNWGTQTVVSDGTLSGNGTSASPLSVVGDLADNQTLSISGSDLSISGGNSVSLPLSPWTTGADIAYYGEKNLVVGESSPSAAKTKSGEISIPPKFLIETEDKGSLKLVNNSASQSGLSVFNSSGIAAAFYANSNTFGTYFGNGGSGPAAWFGDNIQIVDGTQGAGKVLTSNADGAASWQEPAGSLWSKSGSNIYFTDGKVGIGTATPSGQLNVYGESTLITGFNSGGGDNIFDFGRPSQANGAWMFFNTGNARKFYIAMANNSDALRIFANSTTKGGLQIESNGNVTITTELNQTNTGSANMLPFAYGYVSSTGNLTSGTSNVTVSKLATGQYKVNVTNLTTNCIIQVSGIGTAAYILAKVNGIYTGNFVVATWDTKVDGYADCAFSFVVYKP